MYLQEDALDDDFTRDDCSPFIAVIEHPLMPKYHRIFLERKTVLKNADYFDEAVALFLGFICVLNLQYNSKHTYEFFQRALLGMDTEKGGSKRVTSLISKLNK